MDDITKRLIDQADAELRAEIKAATETLDKLLRDGVCGVNIKAKRSSLRHDAGLEFDTGGSWPELLEALREDAFQKNAPKRREAKVAGFMRAINDMQSKLDELKGQVS